MQATFPCPRCGVPVANGVKFCASCGAPILWGLPSATSPSRSSDSKTLVIVVVVVLLVIIVPIVLSAVLYIMVSGLIGGGDPLATPPSVIIASQGCTPGTCTAVVTDASRSVGLTELSVTLLVNGAAVENVIGLGNLPVNVSGLTLSFVDTSLGGTFNAGDQFVLDGVVAGSTYEIQLNWNDVDVFVPIASVVLSP